MIRIPHRSRTRRLAAASSLALGVVLLASCSQTGAVGSAGGGKDAGKPVNPKDVALAVSVRTLSNPYQAQWADGAKMYAKSIGKKITVITDNGDSQAQDSSIRSLANSSGKTLALNVDPNTNSDTQAIVQSVKQAGGYVVTQWNTPDNYYPWTVGDNWVAHISFDGNTGGEAVSKILFDKMGGSGGIIALQGILDNVPEQQRFNGLKAAISSNPKITLLDAQSANWDRNQGFKVTQTLLAKDGKKVKGVWSANDDMALGALKALKAAGLEGKIPVVSASDATPEALADIKSGDTGFLATVSTDAYWQGAAGMKLAYEAAIGKITPSKESNDRRAFYAKQTVVTSKNVDEELAKPSQAALMKEISDPFSRSVGPIKK